MWESADVAGMILFLMSQSASIIRVHAKASFPLTGLFLLQSNSQNREHLKNFRNIDCVLANHNKGQDRQANLKTTN